MIEKRAKKFKLEHISTFMENLYFRFTPLHYAAKAGHFDICKYIIENTNDINSMNSMDETPLSLAEENDHKKISQLLKSAIEARKIKKTMGTNDNPRKRRKIHGSN